MNNILVAVDGSDDSMRAVELGSQIAHKFDAKLSLLRVLRESRLPDSMRQFAEAEQIQGGPEAVLQRAAEHVLLQAEAIAKENGANQFKSKILVGPPARTIVRYATEKQIDLIVMGRRGLSANSSIMEEIGDLLMGGVSRRVSNLAECSCMTVA